MSPEPRPSASMTTVSPRRAHRTQPMTVDAMRAAVIAIRAGVFDGGQRADGEIVGSRPRAVVHALTSRSVEAPMPWTGADVDGPVVLVLAGHAGAGASIVALAVAEGLADGRWVQLAEYAEPARSGLATASSIELGVEDGWRKGRRGRLDVLRLPRVMAGGELPAPPGTDDRERLLVVDPGWSLISALLDSAESLSGKGTIIVVTRLTVPALRQTEHLLAAVGGDAWVAAVGPSRWPRAVEAGCGSRLRQLRSRGRVVRVPIDTRLASTGLTGDPLPKSVAVAGRSLAMLILPNALPSGQGTPSASRRSRLTGRRR